MRSPASMAVFHCRNAVQTSSIGGVMGFVVDPFGFFATC